MKSKNLMRRVGTALLCVYLLVFPVFAKELVPVGKIVGLELRDNCVTVADFDENSSYYNKYKAFSYCIFYLPVIV